VSDDHITVAGAASRTVVPGVATWRVEAVAVDDDPRTAFERCSGRLNALVARLAAVGEVATDAVVVQPHWENDGPPKGAEAIGAVRVRSAADRAGEVAQAAMAAGADRLHGPSFVYESEAVHEELLADALAAARRKAERLAGAASRQLGRVISIEEQGARRGGEERVMAAAAGYGDVPPDVRPREQTVTAQLTVVFGLEP
jgi:hypothetical protein